LALIIAISGTAMFLPMRRVVTEFNSRVSPLPVQAHSGVPSVESWSYTPRYLTGAKFAEWQITGKDDSADLGRGISFKDEAGVFTSPDRGSACGGWRPCCGWWINPR
jgi:hypothetical protein